jgi:hypothetical protein
MAASVSDDKGLDVGPAKDDDLDGSKLLASTDGLEKAAKLLNPLTTLAPKNTEAWIAIYDVAIRRSELYNCIYLVSILMTFLVNQRSTYRQSRLSITPGHWMLGTPNFIFGLLVSKK